jgi:hypothetical protein
MAFSLRGLNARAFAFLFSLSAVFAQVDRAVLTGVVTDASEAAVGGAVITVESEATGFRRQTQASSEGFYRFPALPVGSYEVLFEAPGFNAVRFSDVTLSVGQARTLNARLEVSTVSTTVEISAEATPLEQTNAEIGSVISEKQIREMPLNGRHWATLMMLAPGAVNVGEGNQNSIRFFGRARDDNNWTFDGVDATGIKDPRQEGNLRLVMSTDAIAEFRVNALPFTAESGIGSGAQVNLVSKSGSNAFHGTLYEYFRNSALDARRPFDAEKIPPFRLNQFGGNLGGPIVRNRTFFFVNYEGLIQRLSITRADGLVPSASFRARTPAALRPLIDAYPVGTGEGPNADTDRLVIATPEFRDEHSGLARVDHRFNDRHSIFFRFQTTDGKINEIRNALLETRDFFMRPSNFTAQWQQVWSPRLLNETKLGVNRSALNRDQVGLTPEGLNLPGFTTRQATSYIQELPTAYSLVDNLSWIRGRHTLKTGGEVRRIHLNVGNGPATTLRFASRDAFLRNALDRIDVSGRLDMVGVRRTFWSGYVQDEIRVTSRFTLNLGLRYEYYTVPKDVAGRGRVFDIIRCAGFCPDGAPWIFTDSNNIAPRMSFAWSLGRTVLRGGYGRYFGPGQNDDITAAIDSIPENFQLTAADAPGLTYPITPFLGQLRSQGQTPRSVQRDRQEPEAHQWTFSVQRQLPASFVAQAAYVGSVGRHQFTRTYVNTLDPVTRRRPLSAFGQIDEKRYDGNSNFHGMQASLQRQFTKGWLFQGQYMWSHSITDNSGSGEGSQIMNVLCRACDRGPADADIRHTATFHSFYQLPFGAGRKYGSNQRGAGGALLGGWDLGAIFTARTGRAMNVLVDRASGAVPTGQTQLQRPSIRPGVDPYAPNRTPDSWLNPAAFFVPAAGEFGNVGRNALRGPGLWQADVSLTKRIPLREGVNLDFRAESFNLFNRAQFGNPVNNISNPQFGRILSTANDGATGTGTSRQLQFMLRLNF